LRTTSEAMMSAAGKMRTSCKKAMMRMRLFTLYHRVPRKDEHGLLAFDTYSMTVFHAPVGSDSFFENAPTRLSEGGGGAETDTLLHFPSAAGCCRY
jgi:hypothetical protein